MGIPNSNRRSTGGGDGNRGRRQKDIANALLGVVEPDEIEEVESEETFDPGEHTVADVIAYVAEFPDSRAAVLDAEKAGKNRVTLVEQLEQPPS